MNIDNIITETYKYNLKVSFTKRVIKFDKLKRCLKSKTGYIPVFARVDLSLQFRYVRFIPIFNNEIYEIRSNISDDIDIYVDENGSVLIVSNNKNELYKAKLAF